MLENTRFRSLFLKRVERFYAGVAYYNHFTGFYLSYEFCTNEVKGNCFRNKDITVYKLTENKRTYTQRITHAYEFIFCHKEKRIGPLKFFQRGYNRFDQV